MATNDIQDPFRRTGNRSNLYLRYIIEVEQTICQWKAGGAHQLLVALIYKQVLHRVARVKISQRLIEQLGIGKTKTVGS